MHKAALRCCCRSPLAAAAAWSSPLLLAAADSSPSHASADNPPLATVSQRQLSVPALDRSAAVAARRSAAVAARRSAAAAARRSAAPLPRRCSTAAPCEATAAFVFGSLPVLLATWISAPPQAGEKDERRFEKRNLCSRVPRLRVHVAVSWSHAKSRAVLGGTLGENAAWCSGHGSSVQADGCGLSPAAGPARHVVLCGHRSVFSSPPGRRNVSPPRIFSTNPPVGMGNTIGSGETCSQFMFILQGVASRVLIVKE